MTPDTATKLDAALAFLREQQSSGEAPPPGEVTRAELARRAGVSEDTIARIERQFRARLAAALLSYPDLPRHLSRRIASSISPSSLKTEN
jgi:transcriptional regulator with XRE-family HTH domain